MAVLTSVDEYKAAYAEASNEARQAKAELDRLRKEFKRIEDAEEAAAAAKADADAAVAKVRVLEAELAQVRNALDSAEKARQVSAGDAEKLRAIKLALA